MMMMMTTTTTITKKVGYVPKRILIRITVIALFNRFVWLIVFRRWCLSMLAHCFPRCLCFVNESIFD